MLTVGRYWLKRAPFREDQVVRDPHGRFAEKPGGGMAGALRFATVDAAATWADEHLQLPVTIHDRDRQALRTYTSSAYEQINHVFREPWDDEVPQSDLDDAAGLRKALAKGSLPEALHVFRGDSGEVLDVDDQDDPAEMQALVGRVFTWPAPISTTLGPGVAEHFDHLSVQYLFRLPAGTPALYLEALSGAKGSGEHEVLVGPGAHGIVHAVYQRTTTNARVGTLRQWWVEIEIVPDDWSPDADWSPAPVGDADAGSRRR